MILLPFLVFLPPVFGLFVLLSKDFKLRRIVLGLAAVMQIGLSIATAILVFPSLPLRVGFDATVLKMVIPVMDLVVATYFAVVAVRKRRILTLLLAIAHAVLAVLSERFTGELPVGHVVYVDQASVLMILLIGVIGGLILFYATGYMKTYQEENPGVKDRRRFFGFTMLVFSGAMFGLVIANELTLMHLFWEATTWASFVLIGYRGDAESERNSFRALNMNLVGGFAFGLGVILLASRMDIVEMDKMLAFGSIPGGLALIAAPVAFLALAGCVKSAQLPFTPWLLGAMVAPTPVSALLHSSTMVKAGVFILLRLAPVLSGTVTGYLVAFIGILTFMAGSFAAISERNAKRILALSTVSNLGLIATCCGLGTYQLVWVAFFLILFHAVAKALLFLSVGTASVGTGSLDVEDMGGLITRMPRVTLFLVVGICAMFIAPFGMLVSKWAAMEAFINMHSIISPLMIVLLAYGSAATVFFWTKWLGILIRMPDPGAPHGRDEKHTSKPEYLAEGILAALAIAVCACVPFISGIAVEPFLMDAYGKAFGMNRSTAIITVLMIVMIVAIPALFMFISRTSTKKLSSAYMSGRTFSSDLSFDGSCGERKQLSMRSYYLEKFFHGEKILRWGIWISYLFVISLIGTVLL